MLLLITCTYIQLDIILLGIIYNRQCSWEEWGGAREDIRGVAGVALATPFFIYA